MGTVDVRHFVERNGAYYFQATAPMRRAGIHSEPLDRNLAKAIERAQYLNAQWDAEKIGKPSNPSRQGTVEWLAKEFEKSDWYRVLGERTMDEADRHIKVVTSALGRVAVAAITRRHCRKFHNKLAAAKSRANANKSVKWLRRLMSYAVEIGLRETNPAASMQLRSNPPRRVRWTPPEIEAFKTTAIKAGRRSWALAVQLGYDSSQRLGDILSLTWHQFDGEGLIFRQAKTGEEVWISLSPESLRMLAETDKRAVQIIVGDVQGKPIGHRSFFGKIFREIRDKAGIRGELSFHDLRRTAATEISSGGGNLNTSPDISPARQRSGITWCRTRTPRARRSRCGQDTGRGIRERKFENPGPDV